MIIVLSLKEESELLYFILLQSVWSQDLWGHPVVQVVEPSINLH